MSGAASAGVRHQPFIAAPAPALAAWLSFRVVDAVSLLTILLSIYLTFAAHNWFQFAVLIKLLFVAALWPGFRRSAWLWWTVVLLWLPTMLLEWCNHEDHVYLAFYWYAVLALALGGRPFGCDSPARAGWSPGQSEEFLRRSARLLIGLCFLFAAGWKLASPDFRDGSLFHYKLLQDDRFSETLARFPGGMEATAILANYERMEHMRSPEFAPVNEYTLNCPPRISRMAHAMTWWTIAIEAFLAVAFLLPAGPRLRIARNAGLVAFALSTYAIAPVMGFGFAFMIMGYANCEPEERGLRRMFLSTMVVLLAILLYRDNLVPATIREGRQALTSLSAATSPVVAG